ncbi:MULTISPECIES: DNA-3-methyladenine glycosylase family protein [Mumia]|uniref:DNA-3-methyladenine glycosylase family protein n=1 Tax=Mumia xiangluensis TaxID=1678900 RepID=A0ABW1QG11_9ACTN|nr:MULTISPECIES: DNA-3-methyladenine glycosylase 2 family protein [Mumia]
MTSPRAARPDATRTWHPAGPVDVRRTLGALGKGPYDPAHQVAPDGATWRASRMATGAVTYRVSAARVTPAPREITVEAWGDGAEELVAEAPFLLGGADDWSDFDPRIPLVARALARHPGLRLPRQRRIFETLVPAIIEQRVPGVDAYASWRRLLRTHGEPAPGPTPVPMWVPPSAEDWRALPSWAWHRAGVDPARSRTAVAAAQRAAAIQRLVDRPYAEVAAGLRSLPGIGEWTAAEVLSRLGDPDAVSVGDYNLAKDVGWAFDGEPADDARMLEILEPWRGQRGRVIHLLYADGALRRPRRGPRLTRMDHRRR